MKKGLTEIVAVLDRSGSMGNLVQDTIGGYNSFIEKQKELEGECKVSLIVFDNKYDEVYNGIDINKVPVLTNESYFARGGTALLDAIGKTINSVGKRLQDTPEEDRPEQVIFVITTDGAENSSMEFNVSLIKEMIDHQKDVYNWDFIFMGANIDAIGGGADMGLSRGMSMNYDATSKGTTSLYMAVSNGIKKKRSDLSVTLDMVTEYEEEMQKSI